MSRTEAPLARASLAADFPRPTTTFQENNDKSTDSSWIQHTDYIVQHSSK